MSSEAGRPPAPGSIVQPNFSNIMEAVAYVTFPISKRDLLDEVGDATVMFAGRNADLHTLIKDLHDDHFESDAEFVDALENEYGVVDGPEGAI